MAGEPGPGRREGPGLSPRDEAALATPCAADASAVAALRLWAVHWPAPEAPAPVTRTLADLATSGVWLATCQRQLVFGLGQRPGTPPLEAPGESLSGTAAYRLLLEVASGLKSAVPGESNVLGQLRRAWAEAVPRLPAGVTTELLPFMDTLLADTRTIREGHLQGIGGRSYGSLARLLLRPRRQARILLIGAGDLARSVLPFFRHTRVGGWNHRAVPRLAGTSHWFGPDEADRAADWAEHLIFTTPADAAHDEAWNRRLKPATLTSLLHFGRRREQAFAWQAGVAAFDLDHVFALAAERENVRSLQLARARAACASLAMHAARR